ncbi:hypothetical protein SAMN04488522_104393 [Pedobacter caeni]|uniref:Uncharacterized protein n=1 Tax=Pedobacter caeni TaxID=288992 RepID=A0A1M5GVY4_9SPHI|nr:hypothetical protein SAMN04488522_104393 [Pedobacter caeni]
MKTIFCILIALIAVCLINFWYQIYIVGRYYSHAGLFLATIGAIIPVAVIILSIKLIIYIKKIKNEKSIYNTLYRPNGFVPFFM